jgi:hypothetical protein
VKPQGTSVVKKGTSSRLQEVTSQGEVPGSIVNDHVWLDNVFYSTIPRHASVVFVQESPEFEKRPGLFQLEQRLLERLAKVFRWQV